MGFDGEQEQIFANTGASDRREADRLVVGEAEFGAKRIPVGDRSAVEPVR
jgi:hypothetical protein